MFVRTRFNWNYCSHSSTAKIRRKPRVKFRPEQPQPLAALARSAAPTGHSAAIPALRTMMRAFLLAAAATVATALTPAQADLLLSLQGRLQELNVRHRPHRHFGRSSF